MTRIDQGKARGPAARPVEMDRLGAMYQNHSSSATRFAYLLTGEVHAAQDLTQEAFVRVARKIFRLRDPAHERAYLYRTILNLARGRGRRHSREQATLRKAVVGHRHETHSPDIADRDEMWQALLQLPLRQRAALFLRYYQDLSEAQAAETMQCSVSAIKSLVNRGLRQLRTQFEGARNE